MNPDEMRDAIDGAEPDPAQGPTLAELAEVHGGLLFCVGTGERLAADDLRARSRPGDVHLHSGRVRAGDVFAALPGLRVDGIDYAPDAVRRGASVVLMPADRPLSILADRLRGAGVRPSAAIAWLHPRATSVIGRIADAVHGGAASALEIAGVTGTNGKTSVAHLASQILRRSERGVAVLGTAGHSLLGSHGPIHVPASHTTPDVTETVRLLARHRANGGDAAVMEVSSHALVQGRIAGLSLRVGAFTNLSREHLDYHRTMAQYLEAKARLWDHVEPNGYAVVCGGDEYSDAMAAAAADRGLRVVRVDVERRRSRADLVARDVSFDERGARFTLEGFGMAPRDVRLPLAGAHNVENALVAIGIARAMWTPTIPIEDALADAVAPPGRLEPIDLPRALSRDSFGVFVDYAHSPDALERVLGSLRADIQRKGTGRLICVFGCGGDRDQGKRAQMGRAAGQLADVAVVTSDNPRSEDPRSIADAVIAGVEGTAGRRVVELDRRRAIEKAIGMARRDDVVLIAGKGHENTQTIGDVAVPFDDRVVASEALAVLAAGRDSA